MPEQAEKKTSKTEKAKTTPKPLGLSEEKRQEIMAAIEERGANSPCPRCGNSKFGLLDGYIAHPLQTGLEGLELSGRLIPAVVVACTRCGFLAEHALGALGLLRKEDDK